MELIRRWRSSCKRFSLRLYDEYKIRHGRRRLTFKFYAAMGEQTDANNPGKRRLIFHCDEFGSSPLHADDSRETIACALSFCALRPGDTDREYFEDYTPLQMEFARRFGEELSLIAYEMEERCRS